MVNRPDYRLEQALLSKGLLSVAGVDEAGRGPLAGPVVAAAVRFDPDFIPEGLNDSKKLSSKKRLELFEAIQSVADCSIAQASVAEIDEINILRASHLAMVRAVEGLKSAPSHVLIDGNMVPNDLEIAATPVVKGDGKSLSIAAASILAKVARDKIMVDLAQHHPGYGWEKNAGYPTKSHISALEQLGITPHHRVSFKPVHNILCR